MSDLRSTMPLESWRGEVTLYDGLLSTTPTGLFCGNWHEIVEILCPASGPRILAEKAHVPYATPGLLKEAPLVGKTLERAVRCGCATVGKMRSASHVTSATWLFVDVDGASASQFNDMGSALRRAGIAFAVFTSWSFGLPGKPGVRARFVVPVDADLDAAQYALAHAGINQAAFCGSADPTAGRLCQAQGLWAVGPDRAQHARRWVVAGGVASAMALVALAPVMASRPVGRVVAAPPGDGPRRQVAGALEAVKTITPQRLIPWLDLPAHLADGQGRERAILRLAARLRRVGVPQEKIEAAATLYNDTAIDPPLDESVVIDRARRYAGAAMPFSEPALFALARDWSLEVCEQAKAAQSWAGTRPHWEYLAAWHRRTWALVGWKGGADAFKPAR